MKKFYFLLMMVMVSCSVFGQLYWNTNGAAANWTDANWSATGSAPFTTAWTNNSNTVFAANSAVNWITNTQIGNINVTGANTTVTITPTGTLSTNGNVRTLDIATGSTLDFAGQGISTTAGTGFIKNGTGVLGTGTGAFTGGFTLNAGTVIARGQTGMGSGGTNTLTLNGGAVASNLTRSFDATRFPGGIVIGGNVQFGELATVVALASSTANLSFANDVSLGSSVRFLAIGNNGTNTFSGVISGTGTAGITVVANPGASGSIILTGQNTYSGITVVSSGTLQLNRTGGTTLPVANNASIMGGGTLRISSNQILNNLTLETLGILTVDAGATLTINGTFNHNGGNITGTGTIAYGPLGILSYGAATMQTTTSMEYPAVNVPNSVIINNASDVNLHATRTLVSLTFTNGHLILGTNNLIVSILGSISGASSSRYIVTNNTGALVINGIDNNNFTFPVGPNTTLYHPVTINNTGTPDDFSVNLSTASAPACLPAVASVTETWNISEGTPLGSNCTLTFNYSGAATGGSYSSSGAQIVHCTGTTADYHNGSVTGSVATGSGFTTFSPFGITNNPTVLPVNFSIIKASQQTGGIKVEWSNLTETDLLSYSIDRSADGTSFTSIGTANARQNNGGKADYTFFDATAVDGIYFYRINAKETNGNSKYSSIVRVNTKASKTDISIYPNPATGNQISFQAIALPKGQYTVRVSNAYGQQVYSKLLLHNGGAVTEALQLPATIKSGMYNLQLTGGEVNLTKTFILR